MAIWLTATFLVGSLSAATDDGSTESIKQRQNELVSPSEEMDFVRMRPPKPGEWFAYFVEPCQTLDDYRTRDARILTAR